MCWAAKWHGKKKVMFQSMYNTSEHEMIEEVWELMDQADAIVHYNGNKFDIPTLNKEFLRFELGPPTPSHHIDLLQVVRKRFRFPSNKLDYVAQQLGVGAKVKHIGMEMWDSCMKLDPKAWKAMEKYNKQDVVLLEEVYTVVLPWIQNHPNHALYVENQKEIHCPNCGSKHVIKKGIETTQTQQYQRYSCTDCGTPLRGRLRLTPKEKAPLIITQSKL